MISILEMLQWATGLGSFDINDILTNGLGVTVGYLAQLWVPRRTGTLKFLGKVFAASALLSFATIIVVHGVNYWVEKATSVEAGREVGIDILPVKDSPALWDSSFGVFEVGNQPVEPQVNLYSRGKPRIQERYVRT